LHVRSTPQRPCKQRRDGGVYKKRRRQVCIAL